jgi:predicted  nucleic acid-binding Zn-ribbon protein
VSTLTDAALTLVQPLRTRLLELEREMVESRTELASAQRTIAQLSARVCELQALLERWREAVNDPEATLRKVRTVVSRSYRPPP